MIKKCIGPIGVAVLVGLIVGGGVGFFLGVVSTQAGKAFIEDLFAEEEWVDLSDPVSLVRDRFELEYPRNWAVDIADEDYDPDAMFSIESPGSAFIMYIIGPGEMDPEKVLNIHMGNFEELMTSMVVERIERLGSFSGKGALLKGRVFGVRTTTKIFVFYRDGLLIQIVQQCPDEDLHRVKEGLLLTERSFRLRAAPAQEAETSEAGR